MRLQQARHAALKELWLIRFQDELPPDADLVNAERVLLDNGVGPERIAAAIRREGEKLGLGSSEAT